jgi:methyltransferase (TIGR00027 family)
MRTIRFLATLTACASTLLSVEPGKPSRTAVVVLQMRALGVKVPDMELRNPDTLAARLFGTRERQVLEEVNQPVFADLDFADAWTRLAGQQRIFLHVLTRTRAIDDAVRDALKGGATQVVILGAGYDSRAYRMQDQMKKATVFEVDLPATQELKKLRLQETLGSMPQNVKFVPIDFTTEDLAAVLRRAGYRSARKTVFVWEGVSYYLPESGVNATLRFVANNSAPGSTIVFDYESERVASGNHDDNQLKDSMARLARWGEPHIFGVPDGKIRTFVEHQGLTLAADLGPQQLTRLYLTRKDGTRLGEEPWYFAVCVARVPYEKAERR